MPLFNFKKFGKYKAYVKCPNCGAPTEIRIPKGTSVADFVKGGKCNCDSCCCIFYPKEYTTEHFEKDRARKEILGIIKEEIKPNPAIKKPKTDEEKLKDVRWLS